MRPFRDSQNGRRLAALAVGGLILLAAACQDDDPAATTAPGSTAIGTATSPDAPPAPVPESAEVVLYFADMDGALRAERRTVRGGDPLRAALEALAEGPRGADLLAALPEDTRILSAEVADRTVTVDLSIEFEEGYPAGGSAAEVAVVGPLVRTAAEAANARRVVILVEGRVPAPIGSQIDFAAPQDATAFG